MFKEVAEWHRLTIRSVDPDPRAATIVTLATHLGIELPDEVGVADIVFIEGELTSDELSEFHGFFVDSLLTRGSWQPPTSYGIETSPRCSIDDHAASVVLRAAHRLGLKVTGAATGRRLELSAPLDDDAAAQIAHHLVAHPSRERWSIGLITPAMRRVSSASDRVPNDAQPGLNHDSFRTSFLSVEETDALADYGARRGRPLTTIEEGTVSRSWRLRAIPPVLRAVITTDDGDDRPPLAEMMTRTTTTVDAPFVVRADLDGVGIVRFGDSSFALTTRAYDDPTRIRPCGDTATGIDLAVRDLLTVSHRPIGLTDVMSIGPIETPLSSLPDGVTHPRRARRLLIDGIADSANQTGLPTVAGAVVYDPGYALHPRTFIGGIGRSDDEVIPDQALPGDRIFLLDHHPVSDATAQKQVIDALVGTDTVHSAIAHGGHGGLAAAVVSLIGAHGANIDLDQVPYVNPKTTSSDIWFSAHDGRLVVAIAPDRAAQLVDRCDYYAIVATDIGVVTDEDSLVVHHRGQEIVHLDIDLVNGNPPRQHLRAIMPTPDRSRTTPRSIPDPATALLRLLSHRDISSKAGVLHRYDHEILGSTLVRPLVGRFTDGPGDGVVLAEPTDDDGCALGIGLAPWWGIHDPEAMGYGAVDEAIRNLVAVGADPRHVALTVSLSWGCPNDPAALGSLVAAIDGCTAASMAFRSPIITSTTVVDRDSVAADPPVIPSLVVTAVGHLSDLTTLPNSALTRPGNHLVLIGTTSGEFGGSHLDLVYGEPPVVGSVPAPDPDAPIRYQRLHTAIRNGMVWACHDLSEGGLGVALAEMCIGGRLGATITSLPLSTVTESLFSESPGRFIVEVAPGDLDAFRQLIDEPVEVLGQVTEGDTLDLPEIGSIEIDDLVDAFTRTVIPPPPTTDSEIAEAAG
ncbi:MAG: hypothetical protein CSA55_03825 [Ilumatobacter coccineus]|uniref:Phosphoribosylformylglycinamidine synthase n=1 Tax=Ilumatobacter coccineus TaxID=467094 RepID=A0A2G6KA15_9ACTN|nr:MAG: hypothetical protein CSA55_03825 [Ilumatobacter coccineus]